MVLPDAERFAIICHARAAIHKPILSDHAQGSVTRHEPAWMKSPRCPMQSLFFPPVQLSNHGLQHHVQRPRQLFLRQSPKGQTAYWRTKSIRFA